MATLPESHVTSSSVTNLALMPTVPSVRVRFGPYELDTRAGELRLGESKIVLPDQPHKILLLLIERRGDIVTRDEIQKCLWADDVIVSFEVSINQAIRKLRRALNDSAEEPKYIETVGRRGYRLKVPVTLAGGAGPARRRSDLSPDNRLQELIGGTMGAACDPGDLKVMAAALVTLLHVLADLDPAIAEPLESGPRPTSRPVQYWT
jgi:DNA-binding winged helix-turn-helix (wHTH) protein